MYILQITSHHFIFISISVAVENQRWRHCLPVSVAAAAACLCRFEVGVEKHFPPHVVHFHSIT